MPTKLKVLLVLMAISVGLDLLTGKWFAAVINGLLALGVLKGSEGTRVIVMVLAGLGLVGSVLMGLLSMAMLGILGMFAAAIGAGQSAFTLWCLMQGDVQDWMYKRTLPASVRDL
jgi:hypothetical protein